MKIETVLTQRILNEDGSIGIRLDKRIGSLSEPHRTTLVPSGIPVSKQLDQIDAQLAESEFATISNEDRNTICADAAREWTPDKIVAYLTANKKHVSQDNIESGKDKS